MHKTWLIAVVSLWAIHAQAQQQSQPLFPVLACPAIGEEYDQMLSKLDAIKTAVKADANCKDVNLQVKDLESLVTTDREAVMKIVDGAGDQPLTDDQSKTVRDYAENVTKKVAALNDLFTRSNYCFRGDQPQDQISTLAGFVGEASQMVGSLSGPWGAPIALAGNVVAGFLTGLDAIYKSRAGIDFSNRDHWKSYVNSLCTYTSYRDQISHLLDPKARLAQLQTLKTRLDTQIGVMSRDCDECRTMMVNYEANRASGPDALNKMFHSDVTSANSHHAKPYGSYMLQSLGLRDWVVSEVAREQHEANSYWADATGRHLLFQAKEDLEQFLITRSGPSFLQFGITQARNDYQDFLSFIDQEGRPLYASVNTANPEAFSHSGGGFFGLSAPLDLFRALVLQPIDWSKLQPGDATEDLQFQWEHFQEQGIDRFRNAQASTQVVQTFCSFFKHAGFYSSGVRGECTLPYFTSLVDIQNKFATELDGAGVSGAAAPLRDLDGGYMDRLEQLTHEIESRGLTE
jgi:hypothetical protein